MSRAFIALAGAAALAGLGSSYAVAQSAAVGVAALVVKEVRLSNAQSARGRTVVTKQRIALGDLIQTGKASRLQILLLDRASFSIGANASVRIDRFVYDPARGRDTGASVARGAFRFLSGQQNRANRATVTTPVATIGIRGTILDGVVGEGAKDIAKHEVGEVKNSKPDKNTATLVVLRGPGPRTAAGAEVGAASVTSGGATVELGEPMQAAFVPRAGAAPILFRISAAGLARLQDQIAARPKGGGAGAAILGGILNNLPGLIDGGGGAPSGQQQPTQQRPNPTGGKP